MIDFNEELKKYKMALEIDEIEDYLSTSELVDIRELLQQATKGGKSDKSGSYGSHTDKE